MAARKAASAGTVEIPVRAERALTAADAFEDIGPAAETTCTGAAEDVLVVEAARALAALIPEEQLSPDYIIPSVLDKSVADAVAKAVADEAREQGIARIG